MRVSAGKRGAASGHRRPQRRQLAVSSEVMEVTVTRIGAQGDGIADGDCGRLYIPLTVPGDRLRVRALSRQGDGFAAELIQVLDPGPGRSAPPCPHFGQCGGCSLQHLTAEAYRRWLLDRLAEPLARVGLADAAIVPLLQTQPRSRRRATFTALRPGAAAVAIVGFQVSRGHAIVDLSDCHVLLPAMMPLLPALRSLLAGILPPRQRIDVAVTVADTGLDVIVGWPASPDLALRETLASFAETADLARLSVLVGDGPVEPIVQRRRVGVRFGRTLVSLPAGGFLQASREGEAALVAAVCAAAEGRRSATDLFAGAGAFTFPLAEAGIRVHAVDADRAAIAALTAAAGGLPQVNAEVRDLFARPLRADELNCFEMVIFDPPRAGARAQAEQLAGSQVPVVVAVSCNPETFARDARILVDGGYRLDRVTPVDQFLWSAHLELVAVFRR